MYSDRNLNIPFLKQSLGNFVLKPRFLLAKNRILTICKHECLDLGHCMLSVKCEKPALLITRKSDDFVVDFGARFRE